MTLSDRIALATLLVAILGVVAGLLAVTKNKRWLGITVSGMLLSVIAVFLLPGGSQSQPQAASVANPGAIIITQTNTIVSPTPTITTIPPTFTLTKAATIAPKPTVAPTRTSTPCFGIGSTSIGNDAATMLCVPAGDFTMGSSNSDLQALSNEKPQHTVYLDAFGIDKYEVTNALYKKCVDAGKCSAPSKTSSATRSSYYGNSQYDNYPVIYVSWNAAQAYCTWAGEGLPTEAQWEKAARGTDARIFPWGNTFDQNLLNSNNPRKGDTTAVGSYPAGASRYGVMDMAGNVWEWVADWYDENYYASSPSDNPKGPSSGQDRVLRGGSLGDVQQYVRAALRYWNSPTTMFVTFGFRCAR